MLSDLLWELAQLYEENEMLDQAKAAYRLVLKHHRREIVQEIQQAHQIMNDRMVKLEQLNRQELDNVRRANDERAANMEASASGAVMGSTLCQCLAAAHTQAPRSSPWRGDLKK